MAVIINGTTFPLQYKRTTSRPIDSTSVFTTIEDATIYARNTDTTPYVPYPSQIIGVIENSGVYQLVKDDTIDASDGRNHCKLVAIGNMNETDDKYLSREEEDTAKELIHFLKGIDVLGETKTEALRVINDIFSNNYVSGSTGFAIHKDEYGKYHLDIDNITVRNKFTAETLDIEQSKYIGGGYYATKAGLTISKVEDIGNVYKCYFNIEDADGNRIYNQFAPDDLGICKQTNTEEFRSYWRLVTEVGNDYICLSKTDCMPDSDVPIVGDSVVQLGNMTDTSRQGALIFDESSLKVYSGINTYALPSPSININPDESVINAKLINSATGNDINEDLELLDAKIHSVQTQQDKSFIIWMDDYVPALYNLPASDWTTDELKKEHLQDIFYNTSAQTGQGGRAYRFEYNETDGYYWKEITDKDTIAALEQAQKAEDQANKAEDQANKAEDIANSKKRIFVAQPDASSEYDVGDMWVNATYSNGLVSYDNDTLVCITRKLKGEAFDIAHWQPASTATTAYLENLGNQIVLAVSDSKKSIDEVKQIAQQGIDDAADAASKAQQGINDAAAALGRANSAYNLADSANAASSENTSLIQQNSNSITALTNKISFDSSGNVVNIAKGDLVLTADFNTLLNKKITFDSSGNVKNINTAGLVTTSDFAQMFAEQADSNDYVKRAEISTFITEDEAGKLISNATIEADNINFIGKTMINGNFKVDTNGNVTMNNSTMNNIVANNGKFGGVIEVANIYYRLAESGYLNSCCYVFTDGEYTLPAIKNYMATEIRVFVYNPSRSATLLKFNAASGDVISLSNGSTVFSESSSVNLLPNVFYRLIGCKYTDKGVWIVEKNDNIL